MTVDLRAIVATDLGICVSGDVGSNHISDRSGLVMTSGRLQFDGIVNPPRGTLVSFLVACPQKGTVTRFPKPLRVIRSVVYPLERRSEIEVGCKLTLMKDRKDPMMIFASQNVPGWHLAMPANLQQYAPPPINAMWALRMCLSRIGISISGANQVSLSYNIMRSALDLSEGYVSVMGKLLISAGCFGRLRPDETFEIIKIDLTRGQRGPVLQSTDLVSLAPITGGSEPPDAFIVKYRSIERGN